MHASTVLARVGGAFGQDLVVYARPLGAIAADPLDLPPGVAVAPADRAAVRAFFAAGDPRGAAFEAFVAAGFPGVFLHGDGAWRATIWTATPTTAQPPHLPTAVRGRTWLIHGHTLPAYRNQGYLKLAIRALGRRLLADGLPPDEPVLADVLAPNAASRRSLLGMGFVPRGTLRTARVPRTPWVWGRWRPERPHPAYPTAA